MNPEPIAPAAPILVHSLNEEDSQDGYSQQQEVGDRINIDICTSEPCMHKFGAEKTARGNAVPPRIGAASYAGVGAGISSDIRVDIRPPFCQQKELQTDLNADHEGDLVSVPPYASAVPPRQDSVHIQQTPELQPAVSSLAELDLDEDPRYQYVTAENDPHKSQDRYSESCAKCYTRVMQLYSYRACSRHIMRYQCGRFEDLVLNDKLRRAYVAGWAMLVSSVFPLAPNHAVRCFWALCQLMLILSCAIVVVIQFYITSGTGVPAGVITYAVLMSLALLLAFCDTVSCFGVALRTGFFQQRFQPPEAEPLLHRNRQTWSCCKDLLYRYNDFLRLIVAELVIYIILVTALLNYCYEPYNPNLVAIYASVSIFGICVYLVQFLFFVIFFGNLWRQLKPLPATRCKAMWLLLCFFLHFIGYKILQTLSLVILVLLYSFLYDIYPFLYPHHDDLWCFPVDWSVLTTAIFTYLTPVVGNLTFFILKHGWIQDLCIVYCTDYLSYLNTIQRNANTQQETKQSIRAALTKFEFETLMQESQKYRKWSRMVVNFVYPFLSPLMFVLSIPNVICLVALFVGIFTPSSLLFMVLQFGFRSVNVGLLIVIFANNVHLVLVIIVWPVLLVWECIRFYIYIVCSICRTIRCLVLNFYHAAYDVFIDG